MSNPGVRCYPPDKTPRPRPEPTSVPGPGVARPRGPPFPGSPLVALVLIVVFVSALTVGVMRMEDPPPPRVCNRVQQVWMERYSGGPLVQRAACVEWAP